MTPEPPSKRLGIVRELMAAWGRHDIDGVMTAMHPDILWHYHVGSRPMVGVAAVEKFLERLSLHQLDLDWKLVRWAENEDCILLEGTDDYVNPAGHGVQAPYMGVFEFDASDRITAWRDYVDRAVMSIGEDGSPLPDYLQALVDRPAG